ncbi:hypothetical protein KW850_05315 [Bacillus sp. sid0103]|uniref:hypothetical protein n=1 Tax=Bacillus sp. sid0103 TaxID=2856337 RepID=UPI001C47AF71|nr:hypothetical protein [Bacillus sp. sid0103]MBV7504683.1 hypothetical protein [Bacillus sp. sid0103]
MNVGLVIYLIIAWLVLTVFFSLKKKLPSRINIIQFLVIQIVQINIFTIVSFNMKLFTFGKGPVEFITVLVHRDIVIPYLLLLFVNLLFFSKKLRNRILISVIILIMLLASEHLLRLLGYSHNHHWSVSHYSLICMGMMGFSLLTLNLIIKLASKEKLEYDRPSNL